MTTRRAVLTGAVAGLAAAVAPLPVGRLLAVGGRDPGVRRLDGLPPAAGAASAGGGPVVSEPVEVDEPFALVGAELPGDGVTARVRTSPDGADWGPWRPLPATGGHDHGPDASTGEATAADGVPTDPVWTGGDRWLQLEVAGASTADVAVHLVGAEDDPDELAGGVSLQPRAALADEATLASPGALDLLTRAQWGADESLRNGTAGVARSAHYAVVHHTVTGNDYSASQAAGVIRSIYRYHTQSLGWWDIGYNLLVDRFGVVYEGRYGGVDRPVIGAHARGFNVGSFGVALLGTFDGGGPPAAARQALARTLLWKMEVHHLDPTASVTVVSGGSSRYPEGTTVRLPRISGHRDVGRTACPGGSAYTRLGEVRDDVEALDDRIFLDLYGSVHRTSIETLALAGVANGYADGTYRPNDPITRAAACSLIVRALGLPLAEDRQRFADVPAGGTHSRAINTLFERGAISGCWWDRFCPDEALNRGQLATILVGALDELEPTPGAEFVDVPPDNVHHHTVHALAAAGIAEGCSPGRYCPWQPVTRGQLASMLDRTRVWLG